MSEFTWGEALEEPLPLTPAPDDVPLARQSTDDWETPVPKREKRRLAL